MTDFDFQQRVEKIDLSAHIARGAIVLGDVTVGAWSSIWFNAVVRSGSEAIRIGRETNVQDLAVLHADCGFPCVLGDRVTVGHAAVVHGAAVEDEVMIGIRAGSQNGEAPLFYGEMAKVGNSLLLLPADTEDFCPQHRHCGNVERIASHGSELANVSF